MDNCPMSAFGVESGRSTLVRRCNNPNNSSLDKVAERSLTTSRLPHICNEITLHDSAISMSTTVKTDRTAVALSMACIAHCVALPVLAISMPFLAAFAESEWVHWLLTALAVSASTMVITSSHSSRTPTFLIPAILGLALITSGLFAESFGIGETLPTAIGGGLLASAHIYRLFKHT